MKNLIFILFITLFFTTAEAADISSVVRTGPTANSAVAVTMDDGNVLGVPDSSDNRHWRQVQEWVADGGMIAPYVPPAPEDPADAAEAFMQTPFGQGWVKRQARKEGKTVRQIIDEIRADSK